MVGLKNKLIYQSQTFLVLRQFNFSVKPKGK